MSATWRYLNDFSEELSNLSNQSRSIKRSGVICSKVKEEPVYYWAAHRGVDFQGEKEKKTTKVFVLLLLLVFTIRDTDTSVSV